MEEISEDILNDAFGRLSVQDKAKYLATLFINDIAKVIQQGVDPNFELSRYGEDWPHQILLLMVYMISYNFPHLY